jgi:hypothetical protein
MPYPAFLWGLLGPLLTLLPGPLATPAVESRAPQVDVGMLCVSMLCEALLGTHPDSNPLPSSSSLHIRLLHSSPLR